MYKFIIFIFLSYFLFAQDFYKNRVTVKFKADTPELISSQKKKEINLIKDIIGTYEVTYFVNESILNQIDKKYLQENSFSNNINPLRQIFVLKYNNKFNPETIADKIENLTFIDYAEPQYIHKIFDFPNDLDYGRLYHIPQVKADSAWSITDSNNKIIIGVVDTGVDYLHDDLSPNIYINIMEYGLDSNGIEKSSNGIDDDGNGFIDDWRGWDFAASDSLDADNDPAPGNKHGTHVAGISAAVINNLNGVAGVANNALIMPVKIGKDDPNSRSTYNSYDGLLYAALSGADIINCSWGSQSKSEAEAEIVKEALTYGPVIVAAAGNDGADTEFFPASYDGILSVAAVDSSDKKAWWSNYNYSVDVSAPGVDIFSTIPNSIYQEMSGTSMASPVVAGVAAMVKANYPYYSYHQIIERIIATTDNIDSINSFQRTKLGTGRVNAYKAIRNENIKSVYVKEIIKIESEKDNEYNLGEIIDIQLSLINYLNDIDNLVIKAFHKDFQSDKLLSTFTHGSFNQFESILTDKFSITLPDEAGFNEKYEIIFKFFDGNRHLSTAGDYLIINPSYKTFDNNNISVTVSSQGNIGYNDYPENQQGIGFKYLGSSSLTYEGALLIAADTNKISNIARGSYQLGNNMDFSIINAMNKEQIDDTLFGQTVFKDDFLDSTDVGVEVIKSVYQYNQNNLNDVIFVIYDIINKSGEYQDSLFTGIYFDWDIGISGRDNKIWYDEINQIGICKNINNDTLPVIGVKMLSDYKVNFFAIDNDGSTESNPGVYDGFTYKEKWKTLSSGIGRKESNSTDASMVIGAGPLTVLPDDTVRISYAIFANNNETDLINNVKNTLSNLPESINFNGNYSSIPQKDLIYNIYPNPTFDFNLTIEFEIKDKSQLSIDLYDLNGKKINNIFHSKEILKGHYFKNINLQNLAEGVYFISFKTDRTEKSEKIIIHQK